MARRCSKCRLHGVELSHDGTATCQMCGFVVDGDPIDTRVDWNSTGEQIGTTTDGSRPRLQKTGTYDRAQVAEDSRRHSRQVLREVATTLRMSQYEEVMWGYFERVVAGEWGKGEWVRVWSAAVANIVARTRQVQVLLSISDIATALNINLRRLYSEYRTIVGLLRVRQVLEAAEISTAGIAILLEEVNVHNGEIFSLKASEVERLGVPRDDIPKVVALSLEPVGAGGSTRFPLPVDGTDPRDLIDRLIKRMVPDTWFRDNPVSGNSTVVNLRNACFWLLTLALRASLGTGRKQEPLAAAATILAAESAGLRAPGRQLALVMRPANNGLEVAQPAANLIETLELSNLASRLGVAQPTLRTRYRELRRCALDRVQSLPWGESVSDRSLNDYLTMLIETEESLSQRESRHRTDQLVQSATASGQSAGCAAHGAPGIGGARVESRASRLHLTSGNDSSYGRAFKLPPAFLANKKRRDDLTARVHAAQSRLSRTVYPNIADSETKLGQSIDHEMQNECNRTGTDTDARIMAETGPSKRRRMDPEPSAPHADGLANADVTKISTAVATSTTRPPFMLNCEDLAIERQLLAGISPADIVSGSLEGRHASQHNFTSSNELRQQAVTAVEGRVHNLQSSATQPRSSTKLATTDLSDELLQPGGDYLRSEAEIAVLKRWMK